MNKLLIVFLAVCLISVHAFVKRDAPAPSTEKNYVEDISNKLKEISNTLAKQVQEAANPDLIKQKLDEFGEEAKKLIDQFTPKKE